jgi:hypothetical protein
MNSSDDPRPAAAPDPGSTGEGWPARPARRRLRPWPLLLAAVVTLVAVWWAFHRGPATFTDLASLETLPYSPVDLSQAGSPTLAPIFNLGMKRYEEEDWTGAIEQLTRADRMLRSHPSAGPPDQPLFIPMMRLYLGVCRLRAGQLQEALAIFDELADPQVALALRERGLWYGAQARLLLGDGAGAALQLDQLTGSPVYAQSAPALAAKVRERLGR